MFLYNKKKGYMVNVDMIKDIFLGRESGTLAIGFKNGAATKLIAYSSEVEALEAINMIAERMSTSTRVVICIPDEEEVTCGRHEEAAEFYEEVRRGKKMV